MYILFRQKKQAYGLMVENWSREAKAESDLKIRKIEIVTVRKKSRNNIRTGLSKLCIASGGGP